MISSMKSFQEQERLAKINAAIATIIKARKSFIDFSLFIDKSYQTPDHVKLIGSYLDRVESGEIKRLMIFEPPRHGKSEEVSRKFPAYYLGRNPDKNVIISSYAKSLCRTFSRRVRSTVESEYFRLLFTAIKTADDSRSVDQWEIANHKGGLMAMGVEGAITGHGADLFIIDDPIKDRADAESQVIRDNTFDWYQNVVLTRLEPSAALILMMTRWHQDDLAGRILASEKDWVVLNLPAIIEDDEQQKNDPLNRKVGDLLWPGRYSIEEILNTKAKVGSRAWNALYQGRPLDAASQRIKRDWIRWYDELPPETTRGGGIDTATSVRQSGDNMAFVEVAKDKEGFIYVDDAFCEQISVKAFEQFYLNRVKNRKFANIFIEDNNAGEAIRQGIVEACRAGGGQPHPKAIHTSTDKGVRVSEYEGMIENGTIKFKRGNRKVEELVERLLEFPQCAHDDDIDALGFAIKSVMDKTGVNIRWV